MKLVLLVWLLCICCGCCWGCNVTRFHQGKFNRCEVMDDNYNLYWKVEGDYMLLGIELQNNQGGWVGFGLSISGAMKGADIVVIQKENGVYGITDRWSTEYAMPQIDDHSDVELLEATEGPVSIFCFNRKLKTCDGDQDVAFTTDPQHAIYAYGKGKLQYHGTTRGLHLISFLGTLNHLPIPDDSQVLTIVSPPFTIPAKETTYGCSAHILPNDRKYHIMKYSASVSSRYVHHIVMSWCQAPPPNEILNQAYDCENFTYCGGGVFFIGWGNGGREVIWDGDFGFPMGGDGAIYVKLDIHYYNPASDAGVVDQSGLVVTYSPTLRKYDAGIFTLGMIEPGIVLPPGQPSIEVVNECSTGCTEKIPYEVHIFSVAPHMHLTGSKFKIQQIRDGKELETFYQNDFYDFGLQLFFEINRTILPGDRFITHCIYDTTDRDKTTYGGLSTTQEMCYAFIAYYPKMSMIGCTDLSSIGDNYTYCPDTISQAVPNVIPTPSYVPLSVEKSSCVEDTKERTGGIDVVVVGVVVGCVVGVVAVAGGLYYLNKRKPVGFEKLEKERELMLADEDQQMHKL